MERKKTQRKRYTGKRRDFSPKEEKVEEVKCNDPSWYIRENQLAKDVASFSFNTALGISSELDIDGASNTGLAGKTMHIPGIMRIHTMPAVGYSRNGSSPINLAAKNLYSWVRHANSGHSNYDSPDLMMYIVAMDSLYAFIWHMQRAYGTARLYSQKNRYVGDALLEAMGFYPNEVRANLADFRAYINMLITKASAFCTPTSMSLFKRHTWMYSGIYKDEDVEKSQMYLYVPDFLFEYNEYNGAGQCDPFPVIAKATPSGTSIEWTQNTLNVWRNIGDTLISRLVSSEDINIMSGDIRKAYGEGGIWQIGLIPEDFVVAPIYSGEILDQIHNTIFTGINPRNVLDPSDVTQYTYNLVNLVVRQDTMNPDQPIIFTPQFENSLAPCIEHFCDMEENEPSPERVLVATRNMIHGIVSANAVSGGTAWLTSIDSLGSDICFCGEMMQFQSNGTIAYYPIGADHHNYINAETYTKFHKAPLSYLFDRVNGVASLKEVLGELGNYIVVDYTDIDKMHQSAILSMLGVPV